MKTSPVAVFYQGQAQWPFYQGRSSRTGIPFDFSHKLQFRYYPAQSTYQRPGKASFSQSQPNGRCITRPLYRAGGAWHDRGAARRLVSVCAQAFQSPSTRAGCVKLTRPGYDPALQYGFDVVRTTAKSGKPAGRPAPRVTHRWLDRGFASGNPKAQRRCLLPGLTPQLLVALLLRARLAQRPDIEEDIKARLKGARLRLVPCRARPLSETSRTSRTGCGPRGRGSQSIPFWRSRHKPRPRPASPRPFAARRKRLTASELHSCPSPSAGADWQSLRVARKHIHLEVARDNAARLRVAPSCSHAAILSSSARSFRCAFRRPRAPCSRCCGQSASGLSRSLWALGAR